MNDVGMFDPLMNFLAKKAGNNIVLVTIATGIIATIAHLDGTTAGTCLITVPAMLPLYKNSTSVPWCCAASFPLPSVS